MSAVDETREAELRDFAESAVGHVLHKRRIHSISCRLEGRDATLEVGSTEAFEGQTIAAIFQAGRTGFTVLLEPTSGPGGNRTVDIPHNHVYDSTDFDG
jgi:hypothetical protein